MSDNKKKSLPLSEEEKKTLAALALIGIFPFPHSPNCHYPYRYLETGE